jgi:hypothetical protein
METASTSNREDYHPGSNSVGVGHSEEHLPTQNLGRTSSHFPFPYAASAPNARRYGETEERILRCPNGKSPWHLLELGRGRRADQELPGFPFIYNSRPRPAGFAGAEHKKFNTEEEA